MEKASNKKKPKPYNSFLKYSGLGVQMTLTIAAFGAMGYWLDAKLGFRFPIFLMFFILVSLAGNIYILYRNLEK